MKRKNGQWKINLSLFKGYFPNPNPALPNPALPNPALPNPALPNP